GVMVIDIETELVKSWNEESIRKCEFKCGVAYSYDDKKFHKFQDAKKFVKFISKAKALVTYNGERFDFLALEKYGFKIVRYFNRWKPKGIISFDIMYAIIENRTHKGAKYPSLDDLIYHSYGLNKKEYNHNVPEELMNHCLEDVKFTKEMYEKEVWEVPVIEKQKYRKRPRIFCPNCHSLIGYSEHGDDREGISELFGYGHEICPFCGKGCYYSEYYIYTIVNRDQTFRSIVNGDCCYCKKNIEKFLSSQNRKNKKGDNYGREKRKKRK
ncbi:MAG: hypothetical protein ACP5K4_07525, partial [Caldisericum sp.]